MTNAISISTSYDALGDFDSQAVAFTVVAEVLAIPNASNTNANAFGAYSEILSSYSSFANTQGVYAEVLVSPYNDSSNYGWITIIT